MNETVHIAADTLSNIADSLVVASDSPGVAADSLSTPTLTLISDFGVVQHFAPVEEVFGAGSQLVVASNVAAGAGTSLTAAPMFQSLVLLLAALYILFIHYHWGSIAMLFNNTARDTTSSHRMFSDQGVAYSHFLNQALVIGLLFIGVIAVKLCDLWTPPSLLEMLPYNAVMTMTAIMIALFCLFVLYEWLLLRIVGGVTLSQALLSQLIYLKRVYLTLTVIVISPTILLFALCPRGYGDVLLYMVVVEGVAVVAMFLKETLTLFIHKKISILNWFLYLCTVEIFPVSLLWLALIRS